MINYLIPIISIIIDGLFVPVLLPMLAFAVVVCIFSLIRRFVSI